MTLNKIWEKLRKHNRGEYRQFQFCIAFSVMLISSYLVMLFCPIVDNTLPVGGDSRKQIYMIFALAVMGCTIFSIYATGLFLRFKSREAGVFMALGASKERVTKALLTEILWMSAGGMSLGLGAGCILAWIIGIVMELVAGNATEYGFAFTFLPLAASLLYGILILLSTMVQAVWFMKKTSVIDIINARRKQEPMGKMITEKYLITGILFLVSGILMGSMVPGIVADLTKCVLGVWPYLFYILAVVGIYRILVYSVVCHRRGRNPQKYYKNLIAYGMLKFTGVSIVRNMLVITLLIMGSLFAMFYTPLKSIEENTLIESREVKYSYRYPGNADEITREEAEKMAAFYGTGLLNYREVEFTEVVGSGVDNSNLDENGKLLEIYQDKLAVYEVIGASEYNRMTGQDISLENGSYYMILSPGSMETFFNKFGDCDKLYLQEGEVYLDMEYKGNAEYRFLTLDGGFGHMSRFVVSDEDYETLRKDAEASEIITHVLFDTASDEADVAFSKALYREFALRQSENMKVMSGYDAWQEQQGGDTYGYSIPAVFDPENSIRETDWQYKPELTVLEKENYFLSASVFFMVFIYVGIICLAAVGIISYTRNTSAAVTSRQVYQDIEKLGADNAYQKKLLKGQVMKIFLLPTLIGCVGIFFFFIMILLGNDGMIKPYEIKILLVNSLFLFCIAGYQFIIYRISEKKARKIIGL